MIVAELEIHSPLKSHAFALTHLKVWYDFVRHLLLLANVAINRMPEERSDEGSPR